MDNVKHVMKDMAPQKREELWKSLMSLSIFELIQQRYSSEERDSVSVDIYVNCKPVSSWEDFATELYCDHQVAAVEEVRSYLPPRGESAWYCMFDSHKLTMSL